MLCRICTVQIQPSKHVLDHAGYTASIWQHELDRTDQEAACPERPTVDHEVRIDDLFEVWWFPFFGLHERVVFFVFLGDVYELRVITIEAHAALHIVGTQPTYNNNKRRASRHIRQQRRQQSRHLFIAWYCSIFTPPFTLLQRRTPSALLAK